MTRRPAQRFLSLVGVLIIFATAVAAQSGRRSTSKPSTSPTPPSSSPAATESNPIESSPRKAPAIQLLVGVDDPNPISGIPRYFADTVLDVCVRRLSQPAGVQVTAGPRTLTRSEATKAAKAETTRYVVWLQVGNSMADTGRAATADEYYVNFMLLEPGTAKIKQSGHVLSGGRRVGNVGVGLPPASSGSPLYLEYIIKDEARQAAERILSALGIKDSEWPRA